MTVERKDKEVNAYSEISPRMREMAEKTRGYKTQFLLARDVSGIAIACISIRNVEVLDVFAKHLFYILLNPQLP